MKNHVKILIIALFTMSFLPGCYTMLKHPEVTGKDEQGNFTSSVYFYDDCSSCHSGNTAIAGNFIKREDLKPVNTYDRDAAGNEIDNTDEYYDYYGSTPYYLDSYYGGYGYYYHRPWWYDAAPVIKERVTEIKNWESAVSKGRNNDGGRNEDGGSRGDRGGRTGTTYTPTPTSTGTSTSTSGTASTEERKSSSGSGNTSSGSSSGSGSSDRGNSTSSTSSSGNDNRSSSGSSGARNNDGQRSTSSGRR